MRGVHVLVGVGAALLVAGCSDRPNDLVDNRYYQDPETTTSSTPPPAQAPPAQAPSPAAAPSAHRETVELDALAMTAADLAEEGVQPSGSPTRTVQPTLPDCQVSLGEAETAYQTTWSYPTGSSVRQYLAEYGKNADKIVADVRGALTCGTYRAAGTEVRLSAPVAVEGQVSWCAMSSKQSACTALAARESVLSVVVVTASTEAKAKAAVTRIAPLAVTALARNS